MREAGSGSQSRGKYSRKYTGGKPYGKAGESRDKAARRRRERRSGKTGQKGGDGKSRRRPKKRPGKPERKNSTEKRFPGFGSPNRRFRRKPLPVSPQPTTQSIARPATFCQQFGPRPAIQSTTRPATQAATAKSPTRGTTRQFEPAARPAAHRKPARSANQTRKTGRDGQKPSLQLTANRPEVQTKPANPARNTSRDSAKGPTRGTTRSSGSAAGPEHGADHSSSAGST